LWDRERLSDVREGAFDSITSSHAAGELPGVALGSSHNDCWRKMIALKQLMDEKK